MIRTSVSAVALILSLGLAAAADAQSFEESQWALAMIGVDEAVDRGYTGAGVLVGVVDSGIQTDHPDLIANFSGFSFDMLNGEPALDDEEGHGTHVAGIIAASRNGLGMRGVAHDAQLASIRLPFIDDLEEFDARIGSGYDYALAQGVRIFNNSWGWDFYLGSEIAQQVAAQGMRGQIGAFRRAAAAGSIIVFSTGNEYQTEPNVQAGLPYYVPELESHWLAVTSVGPTGTIADYANHCGMAAEWCLAAPGGVEAEDGQDPLDTEILSTYPGNTLEVLIGTSMAAPHVTGAVAIARQMFPEASAAQLQRIVLATATDIGEAGLDTVYGWGLLNVGNMARTRDPQAASVFANAAWAADHGLTALNLTLDDRLASRGAPGAWASVIGLRHDHDATDTAFGAASETQGVSIGHDFAAGADGRLGLALAWTRTDMDEDGRDNRARIDAVSLAAYAAVTRGGLFAEGSAGLSALDYTVHRGAIVGAEGTVLEGLGTAGRSSTDGFSAYVDARVGVAFPVAFAEVRPFLHASASRQGADAFAERREDADVFALAVDDLDISRHAAGPGVQLAFPARPMGAASVSADLTARYAFTGGDDDYRVPVTLMEAEVPGAVGSLGDPFTLSGGVRAAFGSRWEASARGFWTTSDGADGGGLAILVRAVF